MVSIPGDAIDWSRYPLRESVEKSVGKGGSLNKDCPPNGINDDKLGKAFEGTRERVCSMEYMYASTDNIRTVLLVLQTSPHQLIPKYAHYPSLNHLHGV